MSTVADYSKIAIVTGASSGIGKETCFVLAERGYRVYALMRRLASIGELDAEITSRSLSGLITTLHLDVTDAAMRENIKTEILDREAERLYEDGSPEIVLVNNAGFAVSAPVEDMAQEDLREQMEVNFFGAVAMTRLFLPTMRQLGAGRIIQVSSGFGRIGGPLLSGYSASKFALTGFSESLHYEVSQFGVNVVLIEPGPVKTPFIKNMKFAEVDDESPYAPLVEQGDRLTEMGSGWSSTAADVADTIRHAVETKHPLLRYQVGPAAFLARAASNLVPQTILDGVFGMLRGKDPADD